jgi:hypothetical protein
MAQNKKWGSLSYISAVGTNIQPITITSLEQPQQLDGATYQSRNARHFYPRSHMPGDVAVEAIADSPEELQQIAYFIRQHQITLLNTPGGNFQFPTSSSSQTMLTLSVPTENRTWRGFIKNFSYVKKGILVVAPTYSFSLTVIFDDTSKNIGISNRIHAFYQAGVQGRTGT